MLDMTVYKRPVARAGAGSHLSVGVVTFDVQRWQELALRYLDQPEER